jgi:steroid delta-isomerase-like uncharacterized protein
MSAEGNKSLVRRFFEEVCNGRRADVAGELFSADHRYHDPSGPGVGSGPEAMAEFMAAYYGAFPDAHWTVEEQIAEGDRVVTRWTGSGTQRQELQGIPPTGKSVRVDGFWEHRIANGKIAESWNVWDTLGMLQQLGVVPAPGQQ